PRATATRWSNTCPMAATWSSPDRATVSWAPAACPSSLRSSSNPPTRRLWTPAACSAFPRNPPFPALTDGSPDMILLENLHKSFKAKGGPVHAVRGVGFEARDGEIIGLLGPNGAGKTTTLRMLYTLMSPDQGRIQVDGIDVARDPTAVRK